MIRCVCGSIEFSVDVVPRFDYARTDESGSRPRPRPDLGTRLESAQQAFVQRYGSGSLDASLLRIADVGFITPHDPSWQATLEGIENALVTDSLVYRYDPSVSPDGLRGNEGTFSLCTFGYVTALARAGHPEKARLVFEKLLTYANHVGLYAEEIGPTGEQQLGNFPQAFTLDDAIG